MQDHVHEVSPGCCNVSTNGGGDIQEDGPSGTGIISIGVSVSAVSVSGGSVTPVSHLLQLQLQDTLLEQDQPMVSTMKDATYQDSTLHTQKQGQTQSYPL